MAIFDKQVDLFGACCEKYGIMAGKNRCFSLPRTLVLFAVIEFIITIQNAEDFAQLVRTVRNFVFASDDQIRSRLTTNDRSVRRRSICSRSSF